MEAAFKQVIERLPFPVMAIITMMQERVLWQGTSTQLKKALRPYIKESPMLFANVLQHVAMLLPVRVGLMRSKQHRRQKASSLVGLGFKQRPIHAERRGRCSIEKPS